MKGKRQGPPPKKGPNPKGIIIAIASIGNMKSPYPTKAYALNATAKGPGLGTYKPMMNITARKKNARGK